MNQRLRFLACVCLAFGAEAVRARCVDESAVETPPDLSAPATASASPDATAAPPASPRSPGAADATPQAEPPRQTLQRLVAEAVRRSHSVGAARLLADAATADVGEARAGGLPQAALSGALAALGASGHDIATTRGTQARATLNVSAPLYDAGRVAELTGWRRNLAEAARLGLINAEEEVGLQTVSLALERGRYQLQARVYRQYGETMSCLVDALQQIVAADKGRASELVQAQKNLQQVQLSQDQTASQLRQTEIRLRRFVGADLPETGGLAALVLELPPAAVALDEADRAADIEQLGAQAAALANYSRAVVAGQKPQVNWTVSGSRAAGIDSSTTTAASINVNIPIFSPGDAYTAGAARLRADAALLQRAEALQTRRARMLEVHEQAAAAFDRARRTVEVVRTSNQVRNFTLQQWQQLGRRSLFDVMAAESDHYALRLAYVNALFDGEQSAVQLRSLGLGIAAWLQ